MKSKRSIKDKASRRKPFVSWSAMESKRFDEALLNHAGSSIKIKHISTEEFSQMFESEEQDREEFFTEMINHFKISMGIPID